MAERVFEFRVVVTADVEAMTPQDRKSPADALENRLSDAVKYVTGVSRVTVLEAGAAHGSEKQH